MCSFVIVLLVNTRSVFIARGGNVAVGGHRVVKMAKARSWSQRVYSNQLLKQFLKHYEGYVPTFDSSLWLD